jgi:hypothetical protein
MSKYKALANLREADQLMRDFGLAKGNTLIGNFSTMNYLISIAIKELEGCDE